MQALLLAVALQVVAAVPAITREEQQAVQWAAKAWKEVDAVQSDWLHVLKAVYQMA